MFTNYSSPATDEGFTYLESLPKFMVLVVSRETKMAGKKVEVKIIHGIKFHF